MALRILGYVMLAIGVSIVIGNLTGGGLARPQGANARLLTGIAVAAIGSYFAFG